MEIINGNTWYAVYRYKSGSTRASSNIEPTQERPGGYFYTFDNKEKAVKYYIDELKSHVSNIIYTIKNLSTNAALRKRLKKYKATDTLEALKIVEYILKTIPDFNEEK